MAYHVIYKKTAILFGLTFRAVYNICAAKILNFFHISIKIIRKLYNILTIQQLYTPFRTISGAKLRKIISIHSPTILFVPSTRPFFFVLFYTSLFTRFFSISLPYLLIIIICASVISGLFS